VLPGALPLSLFFLFLQAQRVFGQDFADLFAEFPQHLKRWLPWGQPITFHTFVKLASKAIIRRERPNQHIATQVRRLHRARTPSGGEGAQLGGAPFADRGHRRPGAREHVYVSDTWTSVLPVCAPFADRGHRRPSVRGGCTIECCRSTAAAPAVLLRVSVCLCYVMCM